MRFRSTLIPLFFVYTTVGALLGVLAWAAYVLGLEALENPASFADTTLLSALESLHSVGSAITIMWIFALIPAGLASLALCVIMAVWPSIYVSRKLRVSIAALLGSVVTPAFMVQLAEVNISLRALDLLAPLAGIGALAATALAYRWPRPNNANAI
jgi:hypothetical protein